MSNVPANPQIPEPLVGFVGDVGGARRGDESIFRASNRGLGADFYLGMLTRASAVIVVGMLAALIIVLFQSSLPSIKENGWSFFTNTTWRPNKTTLPAHPKLGPDGNAITVVDEDSGETKVVMEGEKTIEPSFGAGAMIYGTAVSSLLALLIAVPLSFGSSLFLVRIGAWLSPTFIKSGFAGLVLTALLGALVSWSGILTVLGICVGLALTGVLLWIAWRMEDPRVGPRREIEIPMYGIIALCVFSLCSWGIGIPIAGAAVAAVACTVGVHFLAPSFTGIVSFLIEFLAAIPSIAYGIWGVLILAPFLQSSVEPGLNRFFKKVPFLRFLSSDGSLNGHDMLCAGLVLGIMIVPIITAISRDVLRAVPRIQIEGTQALGATWWQSSWGMLRYGRSGLFGAVMLGLARAAGETMAVAMVIGDDKQIRASILVSAQTMSSLIANEYRDAQGKQQGALTEIALILLLMSLVFNIVARYFVVGAKTRSAQ